jgi:peroxiredoxin
MTNMLSRRAALALTAAVLTATGTAAQAAPTIGQPAPALSVRDTEGRVRSLNEFRGKTVVLEWTNHDCPYVKKHYGSGTMQQLQRDARRDGAVWLSVISSAPGKQGHVAPEQAKQLTASRGAAPTAVLLDPAGAAGRAYDARTTPHMFVINGAGRVVYAGGIDDRATSNAEDLKTARPLVRMALADLKAGRAVAVPASKPYGCSVKY